MPSKPQGELLRELGQLVATLTERVDHQGEELNRLIDLVSKVAVLEQKVEDLRSSSQEWARRLWMILGPLIGAVIGTLVTYYLGIKK